MSGKKYGLIIPLLIVLFALIPRYIYLTRIESTDPFFYTLLEGSDPYTFHSWAENILQGRIEGNDKLLYTSFLALIDRRAGNDLYAMRLAQILLGSLVPLLLYFAGTLLFRKTVGLIAAGMAALYAPFIFYEGTILIATLQVFLMTLLIVALSLAFTRLRLLYWLTAGGIVGLMSIDRGNILFFIPFFLGGVLTVFPDKDKRKEFWRYTTFFLMGIIIVQVGLYSFHFSLTGNWKVKTNPLGVHLYRGNVYGASGQYSPLSSLPAVPAGQSYVAATARSIQAHPGAWLRLLGRKSLFFFNRYEIPNNHSFEYAKRYYSLLRYLLHFGWIAPLGLLGMIMAYGDRRLRLLVLLAISYGVSIIAFFIISRYRLPLVPLLILFAAYFLVNIKRFLREAGVEKKVVYSLLLIGLFWISNRNVAFSHPNAPYNWGLAYLKADRFEEAVPHFKEAIQLYPGYAKAYNSLGNSYLSLGKVDEAIAAYERAVSLNPEKAFFHNNLGSAYLEKGRWEEAIREYQRALELYPGYAKPYYNLGNLYLRLGNEEKAGEMFGKAGQLDLSREMGN